MEDQTDNYLVALQLLREAGYLETAHSLECKTGLFFDMEYLKELLRSGKFREAEDYLSGFAKPGENRDSTHIFFEIKKAAFLEALERDDRNKASEILKDMNFLLPDYEDIHTDMTKLMIKDDDSSEDSDTSEYVEETVHLRKVLAEKLEIVISRNPVFTGKLQPPCVASQRLMYIRNSESEASSSKSYKAVPSEYDVPRIVALTIHLDSTPTSMGFHPRIPVLLLVGTSDGGVKLWDLNEKKLVFRSEFSVWDTNRSPPTELQTGSTEAFRRPAVKRVAWSPYGSLFGVAYEKNLVQLYDSRTRDIKRHWEFVAHAGFSINDLAFWFPDDKWLVMTCSDDKKIQVWDLDFGELKLTLEGHEAPVYSLCPNTKAFDPFFLSMSLDGNVNAWEYEATEPRLNLKCPAGRFRMGFSDDGERLFSCGTDNGVLTLIEWAADGYSVKRKRNYQGLDTGESSDAQFDMTGDVLAVCHDQVIKFWDMNDEELLGVVDAEGDLPVNPQVCFNKDGTLLAVDVTGDMIKILATAEGFRLMQSGQRANKLEIFRKSEITENWRQTRPNCHEQ